MNQSLKKKTISGFKNSSYSAVITLVCQLSQYLVVANFLSVKDFGLFAIVNILIQMIRNYSDFGIGAAIIHYKDIEIKELSSLFIFNMAVSGVLYLSIFIFDPVINMVYEQPELSSLLKITGLNIIILAPGMFFNLLLSKDLSFKIIRNIEVLSVLLGTSVTIITAITGLGVWSFVYGQLVNSSVKTIYFSVVGFRSYKILPYFKFSILKKYLKFGSYQVGEKLLNYITQRIDQLLIGNLLGIEQLGYYNFAFQFIARPYEVLNPIFTKVSFPVFAKLQDSNDKLKATYLKIIKIISSINSPIYLGLAITTPQIIQLLFPEKWIPTIELIQILSLVMFFRSIANPVGSLILAMGRPDLGVKWNIFMFLFSVPLVFAAGSLGDVKTIAFSLLLIQVLAIFPTYKLLIEPFLGECKSKYFTDIFKYLLFSVLMVIGIYLLNGYLLNLPVFFKLIITVLIGIIIYSGIIFLFDRNYYVLVKQFIKYEN